MAKYELVFEKEVVHSVRYMDPVGKDGLGTIYVPKKALIAAGAKEGGPWPPTIQVGLSIEGGDAE